MFKLNIHTIYNQVLSVVLYHRCVLFQDVSDYSTILLPSIAEKMHNASGVFEEVAADLTTSPQQVQANIKLYYLL